MPNANYNTRQHSMITHKVKKIGFCTSEKASGVDTLNLIGPFTICKLLMVCNVSRVIKGNIMEAYKNAIFGG